MRNNNFIVGDIEKCTYASLRKVINHFEKHKNKIERVIIVAEKNKEQKFELTLIDEKPAKRRRSPAKHWRIYR